MTEQEIKELNKDHEQYIPEAVWERLDNFFYRCGRCQCNEDALHINYFCSFCGARMTNAPN